MCVYLQWLMWSIKDKKKKKNILNGAWQNRDHAERILPLNWCDCPWMWGSKAKTIASEVIRGCRSTDGQLRDILLYFWSFCASLKSSDKMVFVSMMWTIPVIMERTSCSADINHLLYYYEKNNISDIDDDNRVFCSSCQEESFNFLIFWWFVYLRIFHVIFLEPFIC